MTAPPDVLCPVCAGPWMPYTWSALQFVHTNTCSIRDSEDATAVADRDRAALIGGTFERATTPTELTLLALFGKTATTVVVDYVTNSARRRTFPRSLPV